MEPSSAPRQGVRRAVGAVLRRIGYAAQYRSRRDWLTSYYDALVRATPRLGWPAAGRVVPTELRALRDPLHLRLGTTDGFVAEEVFLRDVYAGVREIAPADTRTILDLGANVGLTLVLWHAWWPEARLWAVEPDADNLRVLRLNAAPFADRVEVIRACAVGQAREVTLERNHGEAAYRIGSAGAADGVRVPGRSVADLLDQANLQEVDLLKCDIEGAEREVFAHADAWIGRVRSMVVEVHDGLRAEDLLALVERAGGRFTLRASEDPTVALLQRRP